MTAGRERLIVALDVPSDAAARALVDQLQDSVGVFKIGLELLFAGGVDLARELAEQGHKVFLDAKLLDISNTVERSTARVAALGSTFLTVHGSDSRTLDAAVRGRSDSDMKLLAITVLTHLGPDDLREQGIDLAPEDMVLRRARMAHEAGFDGVVASAREAARIREEIGSDLLIVTPGIRPAGADHGDQKRVTTPADAMQAGSDYLVVGRPITTADDPRAAANAIANEMAAALQS